MNIIGEVEGRFCILIDDIVDSAGTLCNAAAALTEAGAAGVVAYITHGVLSGGAVARVEGSVLEELVITDSIGNHELDRLAKKIRHLTIAPLLGEAIKRIADESSVSSLFDVARGLPAMNLLYVSGGCAIVLLGVGGLATPIGDWYRHLAQAAVATARLGVRAGLDGHPRAGRLVRGRSLGTRRADAHAHVIILFAINAVCHFLWSPLFFRLRRPDWALVEVVFLWGSLVALLVGLWPISHKARLLIVPYFLWVSFAACPQLDDRAAERPFRADVLTSHRKRGNGRH